MEGVANDSDERVLVLAATNLPQEIDPAAMRRFPYRIHIRLPDDHTRFRVLGKLLEGVRHNMSSRDLADVAKKTHLYSASDLKALARDAVMYPLRCVWLGGGYLFLLFVSPFVSFFLPFPLPSFFLPGPSR
jgi:SpoVK/Ycf46/Vps4 family AAA+-type ATPase